MKPRHAAITGASSGIGKALAEAMAARGYRLSLFARREAVLNEIRDSLKRQYPDCKVHVACLDVADDARVGPALEEAERVMGELDIVIANAGIVDVNRTGAGAIEKDKRVIQVNLVGAIATVHGAVRLFRQAWEKNPGARKAIAVVSSFSAYRGIPGSAAYSASKAGLSNYMQAVRTELRNKPIDVTTIHPGFINTELSRNMGQYPFVISAEKAAEKILTGLEKGKKDIIVPAFPWCLLKMVMPRLPDGIVARFF